MKNLKRIGINLILLFLTCYVYGQKQLTLNEFKNYCNQEGIEFTIPKGYKIKKVKENPNLGYSFAIAKEDNSIEVRYTIWPLKNMIKQYKESLKDDNMTMVNPNNVYSGRVQANVLNMTGGVMYNVGRFPAEAVKKEFNADVGGSCFLEFNCEFGKGYKYGQFIFLHKDNIADIIVTFMSNDKSKHSDLMMESFYSLKFKHN